MDVGRNDMLAELANDAALERTDFVVQATEQMAKFLDRHRERIAALGGMTLIDDDPDYLSVAPDLTFRVRSRYEDPATGEWVSDTEIVETASELIELYNPAEIYQAFAEAAREAAGLGSEPTATDDLMAVAGISPEETFGAGVGIGDDAYAGAADSWAAGQPPILEADDEESAALAMYNLALDFQERSQQSEARLIEQFEEASVEDRGPARRPDHRRRRRRAPRARAPPAASARRSSPRTPRASGASSPAATTSSSSTTRRTSSGTSPTRSPRPSPASRRTWRPRPEAAEDVEDVVDDDTTDGRA